MKAIVVDDDKPTVDVIVSAVNWSKFQVNAVYRAYNIAEAKQLFQEHDILLAICDIEMPMGSGLELLKWVREHQYKTQFIFLTNYERFDFAQSAIQYNASGYVVKPFNADRMEAEITTAVQKIHREEQYQAGIKYEQWFSGNLSYVENGFWLDLLQEHITLDRTIIEEEIHRRKLLQIHTDSLYRPVLASINYDNPSSAEVEQSEAGSYEHAISKAVAKALTNLDDGSRVVNYHKKNTSYVVAIIDSGTKDLMEKSRQLIQFAHMHLRCVLTIYIGNETSIEGLPDTVRKLEQLDHNNVASKGGVFTQNDEIVLSREEDHLLNQDQIRLLLSEKKTKELLNLLKFSLESLAAEKKLNASSLTKIRQELLQLVYVYLYSKQIEATQLFGNAISESLEQKATNSVMDMMRWQIYLITHTVDYVTNVEQSGSVVSQVEQFIKEHYQENITRTEIAAIVYLTPEYMAKLFKKETGISLKQYLSDYRISKAKELLADPNIHVTDAAQRVGFDNFSYFSTVFKKATGITPNEYHVETSGKAK